jgi:cytochrome P450
VNAPSIDADLYASDALADSAPLFARIRDAGPVVWLPRHRLYAMGRFEDVRAALRNDELFLSGKGVAANRIANALGRDTTLNSDGDVHVARRKVLMRSLGAKAVASVEQTLAREAEGLVARLAASGEFDAVREFSSHLPVSVVSDLVGVRGGSDRMLRWAAATFDGLGPANRRARQQLRHSLGLLVFTHRLREGSVAPGSWAASVFEAQRAGELTEREARALVIDFVAPALDTTILATTHLVWILGQHPEVWDELRGNPGLVSAAVIENVRLASPIRAFTRTLARDHEIEGLALPQGARIAVLYGSANLDERRFDDPTTFNLHRTNNAHLGWGNGPHTCVGIHLAKLEMKTLLEHMIPVVQQVRVADRTPLLNNTLQGIAGLRASFVPAS